jgi:hypothetical protein
MENLANIADELQKAYLMGRRDELNQIIKWLCGRHYGSDTVAWKEAIKPLYDEIAKQLTRGEHYNV